jgi:iron(III) transport system permease protein
MTSTLPNRLARLLLLAIVFWVAGMPVLSLLLGSVHQGIHGAFTGRYIREVFLTDAYVGPLLSTLQLAGSVGVVAASIGIVIAWIMSRLRPPGHAVFEIAVMAPIFISPFIGAIGWITLGQPNAGMLNVVLREFGLPQINIISYGGTVFIMALFFAPYAYTLLRHAIDRLNQELEEAAAICGAGQVRTIFGVVLPLLWPSLLSAVIIIFILSAEMFSIPGLILVPRGAEFLAYTVYARTMTWPINQAEASAVGLILLLITVFGMLLYAKSVVVQERFITIGPKSPRLGGSAGSGKTRLAAFTILVIFVLCSSVLPVLAIIVRALVPFFSGSFNLAQFSLRNIESALSDRLALTSLWNSLIVTAAAVPLLLCVAFLVALGRVRGKGGIATITWIIASIPIAVPGVLVGVGLIWLYIGTPIYASLYIIVLVMLARFLPVVVRLFETGLLQLGNELEEAAGVCGASDSAVTRHIRLPLLGGAISAAAMLVGTQVFNELTASALLFTSTSNVLPVVIFNYMFDGNYARACALALVQIVVILAGLSIAGLVRLVFRMRSTNLHRLDLALSA